MAILSQKSPISLGVLSRDSGACISDTIEVALMLLHIISYGKVEKNSLNLYSIRKPKIIEIKRSIRYRYLEKIKIVIDALDETPQSIKEIGKIIKNQEDDITEILNFLVDITVYGYLTAFPADQITPQQFILNQWKY